MALKKLAPDIRLILQNQHTILLALSKVIESPSYAHPECLPVMIHQLNRTDVALRLNRASDD